METKKISQKKSEKMNVRDYITTAIMFVLLFLVFSVVGTPVCMTVIGNLWEQWSRLLENNLPYPRLSNGKCAYRL